jgi:hypothetical protein
MESKNRPLILKGIKCACYGYAIYAFGHFAYWWVYGMFIAEKATVASWPWPF